MMRDEDIGLPYLNGVYIAVDAIPDAVLVVDGPYCVVHKTAMQRNHNLTSSLALPDQHGRIIPTHREASVEEVASVSLDRDAITRDALKGVFKTLQPALLMTTSFDYLELVQRPLQRIAQSLAAQDVPVLFLPGSSLKDDWLDGYRIVLETLATQLPLPQSQVVPGRVGIVGYLWDRNEGDQQGNRAELERMLHAVGLELGATWLSGVGAGALTDIASCERILAFPYGGLAAQTLASRLQIPCHDVPLPFGLQNTAQFMTQIGQATGTLQRAEEFIQEETRRVITKAAPHAAQFLAGSTATLVLDPYLGPAAAMACRELGIQVQQVKAARAQLHILESSDEDFPDAPLVAPGEATRYLRRLWIGSSIHQTTSPGFMGVHFGYPDFHHHPLTHRPFFGFDGMLNWTELLAESVLGAELSRLAGSSS